MPIPGVSSITTAMSISGFDEKFLFYGFLPKKEKEIEKIFKILSKYKFSQVFFIPGIKINYYLKKIKEYFSSRKIIIAKEMTKIHENFYRNQVKNLIPFKDRVKGEITVVISEETKKNNETIDNTKITNMAKNI